MSKLGVSIVLCAFALAACGGQEGRAAGVSSAVTGGRVGSHGMVLFGKEKTFLSHIPMYHAPHDIQLIAEVNLQSDNQLPQSFSDKFYTYLPKPFSLDDLRSGALTSISGTIFDGDFENGGRPMMDAQATISGIVYSHDLTLDEPSPAATEYIVVGTPTDATLVHIIRGGPNFDQIVAGHLDGSADLSSGLMVTTQNRVSAGDSVTATTSDGTQLHITADRQLSCLVGPDFDGDCQ